MRILFRGDWRPCVALAMRHRQ